MIKPGNGPEQALDIYHKHEGASVLGIADILYNRGHIYFKQGKYTKARDYLMKSLNHLLDTLDEGHISLAFNYHGIGESSRWNGDHAIARSNLQKALKIREDKLPPMHPDLAVSYSGLATLENEVGNYREAMNHVRKALKINLHHYPDSSYLRVANNLHVIGNTCHFLGFPDSAIYYFEKEHILLERLKDPVRGRPYTEIGIIYSQRRENETAEKYLTHSIQSKLEALGAGNIKLAESYFYLAISQARQLKPEEAHPSLEKALQVLNFSTLDSVEDAVSFYWLLNILSMDAQIYLFQYKNTEPEDRKWLDKSKERIDTALDILSYMRRTYQESEAKQTLGDSFFPIFEIAIEIYEVIQEGHPGSYRISEMAKSYQLNQAFLSAKAENLSGIPAKKLEKETSLKNQIIDLKRKNEILRTDHLRDNDSLIRVNLYEIYELEKSYHAFIQQMEQDYPDYYQLKYDTSRITIEEVQKDILQPNQAIIEYFVGDLNIYIFLIDKDQYVVKKIPKDFPMDRLVVELRNGTFQHILSPDSLDYGEATELFVNASFTLYDKLFSPVDSLIPDSTELIIVPDGALSSLPYEALLRELRKERHKRLPAECCLHFDKPAEFGRLQ